MSKGIDDLKDWAMHNVRLISILPSNKNLPVDTKLTDVLEHDVDERYFLSEEQTNKLLSDYQFSDTHQGGVMTTRHKITKETDISHSLMARDYKGIGNQEMTAVKTIQPVLTPDRINKRQNGRRFKEDGEPMFTLTSQDRHGIAIREATKKGYAVAEPGDSVNISFPDSETRRGRVGKQTANTLLTGEEQSVIIDDTFSEQFGGVKIHKETAPTLRAGRSGLKTNDGLRIRKLTPLEYWRLQGFTDEQFYKAKNDGVSDSQLYKQAGNSVTVNVIDAIAKKLL